MRRAFLGLGLALALSPGLVGPAAAQTAANATGAGNTALRTPRYLVYFDEFSAYLSPRSKRTIAEAAKRAKAEGAKSMTVQARASATGTKATNWFLAETRSSIVSDELVADGIPKAMIRQQPIGQTGSTDPSVYDRRVDIILER